MNVYRRVEVSVYFKTAMVAAQCSFSQLEIVFHGITTRAGLRRFFPHIKFFETCIRLFCNIRNDSEKIRETEVANLFAPHLLHGFDI